MRSPKIKDQMSVIKKLTIKPNLSVAPGQADAAAVAKLRALEAKRDSELERKLTAAGAKSEQASLQPQVVRLRASSEAKGNKRFEQELRQREVVALDRSEPPRRTVTGSYRVH